MKTSEYLNFTFEFRLDMAVKTRKTYTEIVNNVEKY